VPNLIANRTFLVTGQYGGVDVRRLMYQSLICGIVQWQSRGNHPGRLAATVDAQLFERAADSLVDGMRANAQPGGNFLAAVVKVDKQEDFDLARAEPGDWRFGICPPRCLFRRFGCHDLHNSFRAWNNA
jgi:hypothetical protein